MIVVVQTLIFFRESLFGVLQNLIGPYLTRLALSFRGKNDDDDDDSSDEEACADYDDEKGVVFFPPVYAQRYAAVVDCLMDERWCGKLDKIVDLGYHDTSFIKYLKDVKGVSVSSIMGVDVDCMPLRCSSEVFGRNDFKNQKPLHVVLFQGNAADPDYRLIGCDAVVAIEMIEHMLPHDLERLIHTIFGFIKPWVAVITTPNGDFNVLFKSLEPNGFRRMDHYFEWSREQFNDWCSNIVVRYPQYTVSCKGIGLGPEGTEHLGCCSQLALFVSKDYHKQQDLNLNSLALVPEGPGSEIGWQNSQSMIHSEGNFKIFDSIPEFVYSNKTSCMTFALSSPSYFSFQSITYVDKMSQCNIDIEVGKSFLMFKDEDFCLNVLKPRRKLDNKIYIIEDITCRLNCSTLQVRKFSKGALDLIQSYRMDSLSHSREVVEEIKELTKMLNLNKTSSHLYAPSMGADTWNNINWGDNAPYWNQYYKIIKEYTYPFEEKSEDQIILDIVSDEIHKAMDSQCDGSAILNGKIIIPIEQLIFLVQHITTDRDKIRELLEWNGYQIVNNVLVHSRQITQDVAVSNNEDWDVDDDV